MSTSIEPVALLLEMLVAADHPVPLLALHEHPELATDIARAIDDAERSGLVTVDERSMVSIATQTALPTLTSLRRSAHRAMLGRLLDGRMSIPLTTLIEHRLAGLLAEPNEQVVADAIELAAIRQRLGDPIEAIAVLRLVLDALDRGAPGAGRRVAALLTLADALQWSGDPTGAAEARLEAVTAARRSGDPRHLAESALAGLGSSITIDDDPSRLTLIDHALDQLGDSDRRLRAELLSQRADRAVFVDLAVARQSADEAVALARTVNDPDTLIRCLYSQRLGRWHPSWQAATLAAANEMVSMSAAARRFPEFGAVTRLQVFFETGDFGHFDAEVRSMRERVDVTGSAFERLWCSTFEAARALVRGRWTEVDEKLAEVDRLTPGFRYDIVEQITLAQQMLSGWHRGEDLSALVTHDALPPGPLRSSWTACLLGLSAERLDRASVRTAVGAHLEAGLRDDLTWGPVAGCLAMATAVTGDRDHAARLAHLIEPFVDQWSATCGAMTFGPFAWHLGRLRSVLGAVDEARELIVYAASLAEAAGAEPWLARILVSLGEIDGSVAADSSARALAIAERLDLRDVARSARAMAPPGSPVLPHGLTAREAEMLAHVARGLSNKDIAAAAFLSVKTVERHLLNAYTKIGARNRAEATAFALRNGLSP